MLRNTLLTFHILFVVVWLGGGLYDVFLAHEAKKARGTDLEVPVLRMKMYYGRVVALATVLVALTGVAMSSLIGWGYFTALWLGVKQAIMAAVVLGMIGIVPIIIRLNRELEKLPPGPGVASQRVRKLSGRADLCFNPMRVGARVALTVAVWRRT